MKALHVSALILATSTLFSCNLENLTGDGGLIDDITGSLQSCGTACAKIEACGVTPPKAKRAFGSTGNGEADDLLNNDITACATNCLNNNREKYGYSDCQIECISDSSCDNVSKCWDTNSSVYARFCAGDVTIKPIPGVNNTASTGGMTGGMTGGSVGEITIDNNTVTGNEDVDRLVQQPAVNNAIVDSETPINVGSNPPKISGHYSVEGSIDRASNARPAGSPINTGICFSNTETLANGTYVTYCEDGVPGVGRAPIVGDGNKFSVFFEIQGAPVTILFSGEIEGETVPSAEALVTYTYGLDMWEHSVTTWVPDNPDCTCQ
jgi:hypothetical protein